MKRHTFLVGCAPLALSIVSCGSGGPVTAAPDGAASATSPSTENTEGGIGDAPSSKTPTGHEGGGSVADANEFTADAGACTGIGVPVPSTARVSNGHPLLPPKWAFGILWGSYYDQVGAQNGNLLTTAMQLRAQYSGDLMWIDSSWLSQNYDGQTAGAPDYINFKFASTKFPDPAGMIQTLRQEHFHFGVWEWPWEDHGGEYFQDGVTNKYFIMNGSAAALVTGGWHGDNNPAEFDFTNPATVTWWTGLNEPLTNWGVDFLKLDTTADAENTAVTTGKGKYFDSTKNYQHERNAAAFEVTKAYGASHDPDAMMNGARGFIMAKVPSPASDQLPGWWTNDTNATWSDFAVEMGRASQLDTPSTAAYWCGDTGGFSGVPTNELYIRWLEYTAFTPLQEFFGQNKGRFPWLFGTQAEQIQQQYSDLRYRFLPFRYSNALIAYEATPVSYPVKWIGATQFLVGSGSSVMLVQPVTSAGATTSSVALPSGADWIHYWSGTTYAGGQTVKVSAPLEQIPLFVKAGSILPMGPVQHYVGERPADPLTLDVYPSGTTSYTLYEDDGVSEGYLGGAYSTTTFSSNAAGPAPVITIGPQITAKYGYSGQLCARTYVLQIHGQASAPASVMRDNQAEPPLSAAAFDGGAGVEGWFYDAAAKTVWVTFRLASNASTTVVL